GLAEGVRITSLSVPSVALEGDEVRLRCDYEESTEGGSRLYSLKWYKDGQEFYRYVPGAAADLLAQENPCDIFTEHGVYGVNLACYMSNTREVVLTGITRATSGDYKCEVIGDYPDFRKEDRTANLQVFGEHLVTPHVTGIQESYHAMELVALNCSSGNTQYTPEIHWTINGRPIHKGVGTDSYQQVLEHSSGPSGSSSVSELTFLAHNDLFRGGIIAVICEARLGQHHRQAGPYTLRTAEALWPQEYYYNAG
ncbi:unnamed protein product, partial [Meganyctiphanes norvegica]